MKPVASKILLAIDIGGTHIRIAGFVVENETCLPLQSFSTKQITATNYHPIFIEAIESYLTTYQVKLNGIVIGIPGILASDLSYPVFVANVQAIAREDFVPVLVQHFNCPIWLERDSNLLLLGEWRNGVAQTASSSLGIFMGTGIGASFLKNGYVVRGQTGTALELGHIPIRTDGQTCICGKYDCLEAYASGRVLAQIAEQADIPIEHIFVRGLAHSELQKRLRDFIEDNARAVAIGMQLLDPAQVVLGGGVPHMAGFPRDEFKLMIRRHLLRSASAQEVDIAWTGLGDKAFIYGAQAVWEIRQQDSQHRLF